MSDSFTTDRKPIEKCKRSPDGCAICRLDEWCRSATRDEMTDRIFELSELLDMETHLSVPHAEREGYRRGLATAEKAVLSLHSEGTTEHDLTNPYCDAFQKVKDEFARLTVEAYAEDGV